MSERNIRGKEVRSYSNLACQLRQSWKLTERWARDVQRARILGVLTRVERRTVLQGVKEYIVVLVFTTVQWNRSAILNYWSGSMNFLRLRGFSVFRSFRLLMLNNVLTSGWYFLSLLWIERFTYVHRTIIRWNFVVTFMGKRLGSAVVQVRRWF